MDRRLDPATAEQLLAEPTRPVDPAAAGVADVLAQAGRLTPSEPSPALLTAMAAGARSSFDPSPHARRTRSMTPKSLAAKTALVAAALTLTATGAAAATGSLPAEAQDALAGAAERVGFELPRAEAADEADTTDDVTTETDAETDAVTDAGTGGPEDPAGTADDHGRMVASIANSDFESGRQHGEDVSTAARQQGEAHRSDQAAEADQNGAAGEHGEAPVTTPNEGDAATEAGNPAAEQAPVTPNHGTAADDTPAADRPAPVDAGTAAEGRTARS